LLSGRHHVLAKLALGHEAPFLYPHSPMVLRLLSFLMGTPFCRLPRFPTYNNTIRSQATFTLPAMIENLSQTPGEPDDSPHGLLLVGHGTRHPAGLEELRCVAKQLAAALPQVVVEACCLELAEPTIDEGISRLSERGVRRLIVQPLLLFAAEHARRDIPEEVEKAIGNCPQLAVRHAPPLGCHPCLLELSELRFREAIAAAKSVPDTETLLLMVGRGSRDAGANSEMARFSRLRWEQRRVGGEATCYTDMTWPSLPEGLAVAASLRFPRIVVQPHLLFRGELLCRVEEATASAAARHVDKEWILASHLGPQELLIKALAERAGLIAGDASVHPIAPVADERYIH
jgi:sirohydrochlorin cobaltochelatase